MKASEIFDHRDYKAILKSRVNELKALRPQANLRYFAGKIPVQYTYLSKVLNSKSSHLSEDHLFEFCRLLEFFPEEVDYILLLRSYAVTESLRRREELGKKIDSLSKRRQIRGDHQESTSSQDLGKDFYYLFQPYVILVHVALFIKDYQKNPRLLCPLLGLSPAQLKDTLKTLEAGGYLSLDFEDFFIIKEVKEKRPHFSQAHPLMRAHQSLIKSVLQSRLSQTNESEKESFFVTFTADDQAMEKIKLLFKEFVQKVQEQAFQGKQTKLYQMNFDFLKWF